MHPEKIIIFLPEEAALPEEFQNMVDSLNVFTDTEMVRSFSYFGKQSPPLTNGSRPIVVAIAPTRADLERLVESRHLLEDVRLVLLLADTEEETVSRGHLMRPRFIGYLSNGFGEITEVVQKMAGWSKK